MTQNEVICENRLLQLKLKTIDGNMLRIDKRP